MLLVSENKRKQLFARDLKLKVSKAKRVIAIALIALLLISTNQRTLYAQTPDKDGDGIVDAADLDDDNDGILDVDEMDLGASGGIHWKHNIDNGSSLASEIDGSIFPVVISAPNISFGSGFTPPTSPWEHILSGSDSATFADAVTNDEYVEVRFTLSTLGVLDSSQHGLVPTEWGGTAAGGYEIGLNISDDGFSTYTTIYSDGYLQVPPSNAYASSNENIGHLLDANVEYTLRYYLFNEQNSVDPNGTVAFDDLSLTISTLTPRDSDEDGIDDHCDIENFDAGDLPDIYKTNFNSTGAVNIVYEDNGDNVPDDVSGQNPAIWFGDIVDVDSNGQPSTDGLGDDNNLFSDEDGLVYPATLIAGSSQNFDVTVSANNAGVIANFGMWIDWNGDGDFFDAGEFHIGSGSTTTDNGSGVFQTTMPVSVSVPASYDSTVDTVHVRVRTFDDAVSLNDFDGTFLNGETEDYVIVSTAPTAVMLQDGGAVSSGMSLPMLVMLTAVLAVFLMTGIGLFAGFRK